jgi:hypothetical protein
VGKRLPIPRGHDYIITIIPNSRLEFTSLPSLLKTKRCPQSLEQACIEFCSLWAKEKERGKCKIYPVEHLVPKHKKLS